MKNIILILTGLLYLFITAKAQKVIVPYHIAISYSKTSNIIFPYAIESVDRGSTSVLAQKAKGVNNILQIKAGVQDFTATNLSVVTADGKFYSFLVDYADEPAALNISFTPDSMKASLEKKVIDEAAFNNIVAGIKNTRPFLHRQTREQKILLALQGIYLTHDVMCFRFKLRNHSHVAYTPDYIRFFIRDKKRGKRTAVQETELKPLYATSMQTVDGLQADTPVFAFTPFTISSKQELVVQAGEKNGGRDLELHISHRKLLKAKILQY